MTDWRPAVGFEGLYEVSSNGDVRSLDRVVIKRNRWGEFPFRYRGRAIRPYVSRGYLRLSLRDGKLQHAHVHVLVAEAFIGPRPNGMQVCHNDGNRLNNQAANLRYGTPSENIIDSVQHGTHVESRKTHCPQGHPYDEANTWRSPSRNQRLCRTCNRTRQRELYRARKALT